MIPGSNIYLDAIKCIDPIEIGYQRDGGRVKNKVGQWTTFYEMAIPLEAVVQAVDSKTYKSLGLDFQKRYIMIYTDLDSIDLSRNCSGDRVELPNGEVYQFTSSNDWYMFDGWVGILAVRITK